MTVEVKLSRAIEGKLDEIVRMAEGCVDTYRNEFEYLEESQLRNVQNLSSATESVLVLKNFIRYQIGRNKIPQSFGEQIIKDIEALGKQAEELAENDPELHRQVRIELIRLYLGFLVRKFVAEKKSKEGRS